MYHRIVRTIVAKTFAHLNRHDYQPVVAQFTPAITHTFAGTHALGGTRRTRQAAQQWYERLFRLFPDLRFAVQNIMVSGLPGDTRIAVQFRVEVDEVHGKRVGYSNEVAQFIRLQWGKITEIKLYEDTDKLVDLLAVMRDLGVAEAAAPPITD